SPRMALAVTAATSVFMPCMSAISSMHSIVMSVESMSKATSRTRVRLRSRGTNAKSKPDSMKTAATGSGRRILDRRKACVAAPESASIASAPASRARSFSASVSTSGACTTRSAPDESTAAVIEGLLCGSRRADRGRFVGGQHEIDLGLLEIDTHDRDANAVRKAPRNARALADQGVADRVEMEVIAPELAHVHEPVD